MSFAKAGEELTPEKGDRKESREDKNGNRTDYRPRVALYICKQPFIPTPEPMDDWWVFGTQVAARQQNHS
jgi:hypothetical protein